MTITISPRWILVALIISLGPAAAFFKNGYQAAQAHNEMMARDGKVTGGSWRRVVATAVEWPGSTMWIWVAKKGYDFGADGTQRVPG